MRFDPPVSGSRRRHARSLCEAKLGRPEAAIEAFDKAIEADPGNADAIAHKGLALESLGRIHDAHAELSRAVAVDRLHEAARAGVRRLEQAGAGADAARAAAAIAAATAVATSSRAARVDGGK